MIHDLDDHARRLGYTNRAALELAAEVARQQVARQTTRHTIDPWTAFETWRKRAKVALPSESVR